MVNTECCQNCYLWNSCETKWYRGEQGESQICCPLCKKFILCNPTFPPYNEPNYPEKLIEIISHSVSTNQFITAHHFALLLPNKDFSNLRIVRAIYTHNFDKNKNYEILNRGLLLFEDFYHIAERKADVLVNLGYLKECLNPQDADEAILEALKDNSPLDPVIGFFTWLKKRKKTDYLKRLSLVSKKSGDATLQELCNDLKKINLLFESMKRTSGDIDEESLLFIDSLEKFICKHKDSVTMNNLGKFINRILDETNNKLENKGDACKRSGKMEYALKYYMGAIAGCHIFTELIPNDPFNYANIVSILKKVKDLRVIEEQDEIKQKIKNYSEKIIGLMSPLIDFTYLSGLKIGDCLRIYGEILEEEANIDGAKKYFELSLHCTQKSMTKFKPHPNHEIERRCRECDTLRIVKCLQKLGRYDEAIKYCDDLLDKYPSWYEGYLYKGKALMEIERYEESEICFKKCMKMKPLDSPTYDNLIYLYERKGDYENAIMNLIKLMKLPAIKNNQKGLDWNYFRLARFYEDKGDDQIAIKLLKYIISKRQPDHLEAHHRLITLYMRRFEWRNAAQYLEKKIKDNSNPFWDFCRLGDCCKNLNQPKEALKSYKKAEVLNPSGLPMLSRFGNFYEQQNELDKAIEYVTKIINVLGDQYEAAADYVWRGDLYQKQGKTNLARDDYLRAFQSNPELEKVYPKLLTVIPPGDKSVDTIIEKQIENLKKQLDTIPPDHQLYKQTSLRLIQKYIQSRNSDNIEEALDRLENIFSPDSPEYFEYKAVISKVLKNDISEAIYWQSKLLDLPLLSEDRQLRNILILLKWHLESEKTEVECKPILDKLEKIKQIKILQKEDVFVFSKSKGIYQSIAEYFLERTIFIKALQFADILLEKVQGDDKVYLTIKGRALIGLGKYEEADSVFSYLLSSYPKDNRAIFYKGEIQRKLGKLDEALTCFQNNYKLSKKLGEDKGVLSALNRISEIYFRKNDQIKAIEAASELLQIDPYDVVILARRAGSFMALGKTEKAIKDFASIFKIRPSDIISARKLIDLHPLEKGNHNDPEIISALFNINNNVKFKRNILKRLTEMSIFPSEPIKFIEPTFKNYSTDQNIRTSIAHYLSRYSIYINFHYQDQLENNLSRIINLFKSISGTNIKYLSKLLMDFLGGEKGAYLEFYADSFEDEFTEIDKILLNLVTGEFLIEDVQGAIDKIQGFQDSFKIPHISLITEENQRDLREEIKTSINYLLNHGSEISFSLSEGSPIIVDEKTATLLPHAFEKLVEDCLNILIHYKRLSIDFRNDEKNIYLELKGPLTESSKNLRTVLKNIQSGALTGTLKSTPSSFIINLKVSSKGTQILPKPFHMLLNYQIKTYKDFLVSRKDQLYWDIVEAFINVLDFDDQRLPEYFVRYATMQIEALSKLCHTDFQPAIEPYHKIKNKLQLILNGENLSEEDIFEIKSLQKNVRAYLRSCRFPNFEYVSLLEIGENISEMFKDLKLVKFSVDIDADDMIYADPLILQDCIENLIFNACNAVRESSSRKDFEDNFINVRFLKENEHYIIVCKDTGQGMSPKEIKLFRKGKTGGIGSKVILKAVDIHEGDLEIKSKQGEGAEIRIIFNIREESDES